MLHNSNSIFIFKAGEDGKPGLSHNNMVCNPFRGRLQLHAVSTDTQRIHAGFENSYFLFGEEELSH